MTLVPVSVEAEFGAAAGGGEPAGGPLTTVYRPAVAANLRMSLGPLSRGRGDPTMRWHDGSVWRTALTPAGPATLHLQPTRAGVIGSAWGPGAGWALEQVPELLGAGDVFEDFDPSGHQVVTATHRRFPGLRLSRCGLVFEMLVPAVLEQKVTGMEARRSWRWLLARYGLAAPGPAPFGMRVCPPPATWRRIPSWDWHRAGVDPKRSRTIVTAAASATALEGSLALGRGGPAVDAVLRSVPGIGVWTAAEITQRAHGDADSVSVGDYHVAAFVGWCLAGKPVDDDGMLALLAGYAPHRQRTVRLLELSGISKPRFAPRYSPQDLRAL